MQSDHLQTEGNLAAQNNADVEDFLGYLGELIAQEYIHRMEKASQTCDQIDDSEK